MGATIKRQIHGLASLILVAGAMITALVCIWQHSSVWGAAYLLLLLGGSGAVLFAYCAKCPCRLQGCGHVIPGLLTRHFTARRQGPYGIIDYLGVTLALGLMIIAPQPWLITNPTVLVVFWILLAAGSIDILLYVCKGCGNDRCPVQTIRN